VAFVADQLVARQIDQDASRARETHAEAETPQTDAATAELVANGPRESQMSAEEKKPNGRHARKGVGVRAAGSGDHQMRQLERGQQRGDQQKRRFEGEKQIPPEFIA